MLPAAKNNTLFTRIADICYNPNPSYSIKL